MEVLQFLETVFVLGEGGFNLNKKATKKTKTVDSMVMLGFFEVEPPWPRSRFVGLSWPKWIILLISDLAFYQP